MLQIIGSDITYLILKDFLELKSSTKLAFLVTNRVSFNQIKQITKLKNKYGFEFHLDSGAYSFNRLKKDENCFGHFVRTLRNSYNCFDTVYNYDLYMRPGHYLKNWHILENLAGKGFPTVPVLHDYSSLEEATFYINNGCKEVALGQGDRNTANINSTTTYLHSYGIKTRLMGCGGFTALSLLTVDSADSANWRWDAGKYKNILCKEIGTNGLVNFKTIKVKKLLTMPKNCQIIKDLMSISPYTLQSLTEENYGYRKRCILNLLMTDVMQGYL